ncbi:unnamed protein product [Prorocentrum cordatum]|uniref:Transmembrane protein 107 n=1 Tax=Prorocentrum cordatum TaxID=2364126 RepID=A0ABN9UN75_9DINO|nr:unnamed protein product [Polarella glacialis]
MLPTAALDPGIVFALSVFGGVCRVVAATGGAMMFTLCWSLAGDLGLTSGSVKDAAAVLVFWDLASIGMVWAQRRSINLAFALTVCLPWGVCEMAGTAFLIRQGGSPWFNAPSASCCSACSPSTGSARGGTARGRPRQRRPPARRAGPWRRRRRAAFRTLVLNRRSSAALPRRTRPQRASSLGRGPGALPRPRVRATACAGGRSSAGRSSSESRAAC